MISRTCQGALALAIVSTLASARAADDPPQKKGQRAAQTEQGKLEGVILKVEPVGDHDATKEASARRWKVTVNTDVPWLDYVRDTTTTSAKPDAAKGAKSVATKGHPKSANSLLVVEVAGATSVEARVRAASDSASLGARTVAGAERKALEPSPAGPKDGQGGGQAPKMNASDIKPGLYVEVEYRRDKGVNRASRLVVLKPVPAPEDAAKAPAKDASK